MNEITDINTYSGNDTVAGAPNRDRGSVIIKFWIDEINKFLLKVRSKKDRIIFFDKTFKEDSKHLQGEFLKSEIGG